MLLPLGILASSGGAAAVDYELISTTVLSSSQSSVTFSGLGTSAAAYKHLQIRAVHKMETGTINTFVMRANSDTGSNYSFHRLEGDGSSVGSAAGASRTTLALGNTQVTSTQFTAAIVDILDFSSTSKNTTFRSLTGGATTDYKQIGLYSGAWFNTAAVTSLSLFVEGGQSWSAGSRFSIYGLKG